MGRVQDKVALVTGGASDPGLGYTTALTLGSEGARVVVTDIDEPGADRCAAAIRDAGGEALALHQDVTSEPQWQSVVARTLDEYGRLDILVNNAGIAVLMPIAEMTLADWNRRRIHGRCGNDGDLIKRRLDATAHRPDSGGRLGVLTRRDWKNGGHADRSGDPTGRQTGTDR